MTGVPRIAYLNTEYPAISHTFIEREIRAVREGGLEVETMSVRKPGPDSVRGEINRRATDETFYVLDGAGKVVASVLGALAASPAGFVRVIAASQRLSPAGIKTRLTHVAYACEGMRLARRMAERGLRHLHVHMANNGAAVAMMARAYDPRIEYSLSIHGSAEFFHVDTWTLGAKAEAAKFVRCISHFCRAQVMTWTKPEAWDRFHIVHCGIDPEVYSPRPERAPGRLRLLTVGRLHPIKGYPVLLEACKLLADEGLAFELEMVGDGPMRGRLEEMARNLGLSERVKFAGSVPPDDIPKHFDRADVMVVSSFMEGVPVVLMEAMAKEMGVVATRVGGIGELVEQGVSGQLVDTGSAGALAAGIRVYARDLELCRVHGRRGRERVMSEYSVRQTGGGMIGLFKQYLGGGAA